MSRIVKRASSVNWYPHATVYSIVKAEATINTTRTAVTLVVDDGRRIFWQTTSCAGPSTAETRYCCVSVAFPSKSHIPDIISQNLDLVHGYASDRCELGFQRPHGGCGQLGQKHSGIGGYVPGSVPDLKVMYQSRASSARVTQRFVALYRLPPLRHRVVTIVIRVIFCV